MTHDCPVRFSLYICHGIDPTGFGSGDSESSHQLKINVVAHHNTVIDQNLRHIPWGRFDRSVQHHQVDKGIRRLDSKIQLIALLFHQLSTAGGLRPLICGFNRHNPMDRPAREVRVRFNTVRGEHGAPQR